MEHYSQSSGRDPDRPGDGSANARLKQLIVGIGAGAGSMPSLQQFFKEVAPDSPTIFLILMHPDVVDEQQLGTMLGDVTQLPIVLVRENTSLTPGVIYILPPTLQLALDDGVLYIRNNYPVEQRAPIDLFFRNLADVHGPNAAGVLFSGKGFDGANGMRRLKERGGVTIVQEPSSAHYESMPRNAISTGLVDFVLYPHQIYQALATYNERGDLIHIGEQVQNVEEESSHLRDLFILLRSRTGHDFSQYKRATLLRRIGRRMQVCNSSSLYDYVNLLRTNAEESQALLRDLMISVTNFFRDPEAWMALNEVVPLLFNGKGPGDQVRVWVAGCATGEEAYSIAMLLYEYALTLEKPPSLQIFATDIDEEAIATARQGVYAETIAADVSAERLQRFFVTEQGHYRIRKEIRDLVLFAVHNVLRDPPFSRLDLITCRNLLIYLNREIQEQVLQLFHFTLRSQAFLLLGTSESTDGVPGLFTPIDKPQRLFQRRISGPLPPPALPTLPMSLALLRKATNRTAGEASAPRSFDELHQILLASYMPPSVIVNESHDVVHLSRGAARYLSLNEGEPSHNILKLIHPDLRLELRTALFSASRNLPLGETRRLRISLNGEQRLINLHVQPISEPEWAIGYTLIIFNDLGIAIESDGRPDGEAEPLVRQLEEELQRTKDQLRTTIEQYETAMEEYKAANEELQAINEELRTATEELETSKEELQSVNEELTTVNQELKHKVDEVSMTNNDLQNLMASTEIGTIFVDRRLRVKRYTTSAQKLFNLIPSDINRPLSHITHTLRYEHLTDDAEKILESLTVISREIQSTDGRWYLARLLPYRTIEDRIDGVILTFVDISMRKQAEQIIQASQEQLTSTLQQMPVGVLITDAEGRLTFSNRHIEEIFGRNAPRWQTLREYSQWQFYRPDGKPFEFEALPLVRALRHGEHTISEEMLFPSGRNAWIVCRISATPIFGPDNQVSSAVLIIEDITDQKHAEEQLRRAHDALEQHVAERTAALTETNRLLLEQITERKQAEQARQDALRQLVQAQEDERRRLAREIHDHFSQQVTGLLLGLQSLASALQDNPQGMSTLNHIREIAAAIGNEAHQLALDLRPTVLDDMGLEAALHTYGEQWSNRAGIPLALHIQGLGEERLSQTLETTIYRVVQEALTNVLRHAQASQASLIVERRSDHLAVIVEDDGRGFEPEQLNAARSQRLGLRGIQERVQLVGGSLLIESAPGRGTTIFVRIPFA